MGKDDYIINSKAVNKQSLRTLCLWPIHATLHLLEALLFNTLICKVASHLFNRYESIMGWSATIANDPSILPMVKQAEDTSRSRLPPPYRGPSRTERIFCTEAREGHQFLWKAKSQSMAATPLFANGSVSICMIGLRHASSGNLSGDTCCRRSHVPGRVSFL